MMGHLPEGSEQRAVEACYDEFGPESLRRACIKGVRMTVREAGGTAPLDGRGAKSRGR
jgi:hypothetical protein